MTRNVVDDYPQPVLLSYWRAKERWSSSNVPRPKGRTSFLCTDKTGTLGLRMKSFLSTLLISMVTLTYQYSESLFLFPNWFLKIRDRAIINELKEEAKKQTTFVLLTRPFHKIDELPLIFERRRA